MTHIHELYYAFKQADEVWSKALKTTFGKNAGDIRYTKGGETHPNCQLAYQEFKRTGEAWRMAVSKERINENATHRA